MIRLKGMPKARSGGLYHIYKYRLRRLSDNVRYRSKFITLLALAAIAVCLFSKCEGAAVTAGEDPVKIRTSQGMNRSAVDLDYPFLFPKKH